MNFGVGKSLPPCKMLPVEVNANPIQPHGIFSLQLRLSEPVSGGYSPCLLCCLSPPSMASYPTAV